MWAVPFGRAVSDAAHCGSVRTPSSSVRRQVKVRAQQTLLQCPSCCRGSGDFDSGRRGCPSPADAVADVMRRIKRRHFPHRRLSRWRTRIASMTAVLSSIQAAF